MKGLHFLSQLRAAGLIGPGAGLGFRAYETK